VSDKHVRVNAQLERNLLSLNTKEISKIKQFLLQYEPHTKNGIAKEIHVIRL
jgi:hypothetical protein